MQSLVFTCATCGIEKSSNDFQSRIDSDTGYRIYPAERGISQVSYAAPLFPNFV